MVSTNRDELVGDGDDRRDGSDARGLRERIDRLVLKWQGRLDTRGVDRAVPWFVAFAFFWVLFLLSAARLRSLEAGEDMARWIQAAWLVGDGREPIVTVGGPEHALARHGSIGFVLLSLVARLGDHATLLLAAQSASLAVPVVAFWRLARDVAKLRAAPSAAVVAAWCLHPAVHSLALDDFHPETVAIGPLAFALLWAAERRWIPFAAASVAAVAMRSDLGFAIAGTSILPTLSSRRARLAVILAGAGWSVLMVFFVQPAVTGGGPPLEGYASYGDDVPSVLWGMVSRPLRVVGDLFAEESFGVLVFLFAPVLFLPLLAFRWLAPVVPLQVSYLIADVPESVSRGEHVVAALPFLFAATTIALARAGERGIERIRVDGRVLAALLLASAVFFVRDSPSSPYQEPWRWGGRTVLDQARLAAVDLVAEDDRVRAAPKITPLLAKRRHVYVLDTSSRPDVQSAIDGVDVVVFDEAEALGWSDDQRRIFRDGLMRQGMVRVFSEMGVEVYRKP
ncbi:MAG: hypothetical protein KatS3mg008_0299 [Acidimicrobiales bacterium]|nr:MAG: hypothetical protein KatS3mg008_0299 [Acidimicrobiales bacterium]